MNKNTIIAIVIIIILGFGYYLYSNNAGNNSSQTINTQPTTQTTQSEVTNVVTPKTVIVNYTNAGFSPKTVTIAKGDTVNFVVDATNGGMWVASAPHPTHEGYDGTTKNQHCASDYSGPVPFDQCSKGISYSFTFTKVGSWGYHDHGNSSNFGTIIVQ